MSCTRSSLSHGREHGRLRTCIGKPPLGEIVMACTSCRGSRQLGDTLKVNLWKILAKAITASSTAGNGAFMPSIFASLLEFAVENLPQFEIPGACFGLSQPYHLCAWLLIKEDGVYTDMWSRQHMMGDMPNGLLPSHSCTWRVCTMLWQKDNVWQILVTDWQKGEAMQGDSGVPPCQCQGSLLLPKSWNTLMTMWAQGQIGYTSSLTL